jgi:hypothetical protein
MKTQFSQSTDRALSVAEMRPTSMHASGRIEEARGFQDIGTLRTVIGKLNSYKLRSLRRRLEGEVMAEITTGGSGSRSTFRKIAVMTAAGSELYHRGELLDPPPYVEVDRETVLGIEGTEIRLQRSVRVF